MSPTLDLATSSVDHNTHAVAFAGGVDDRLVSPEIFGGSGTDLLTVFVAYHMVSIGGNPSLTRPAGFESIAATQANAGDHFNLASDPSIRKDNGQIGSGAYGAGAPVGSPFIRVSRMDANGVDEWFNTTTTFKSVLSDAGAQYITSVDDFYLGDVRAGATSIPNFPATATSNFSISQVIVFNSALTDRQVADVNEFMLTAIPEPGSTSLLALVALGLMRRRR